MASLNTASNVLFCYTVAISSCSHHPLAVTTVLCNRHPLVIIMNVIKCGYYSRAATISLQSSSSATSIRVWQINAVQCLLEQIQYIITVLAHLN